MPSVCFAAGVRLAVANFFLFIAGTPVSGQIFLGDPHQHSGNWTFDYSAEDLRRLEDSATRLPAESPLIASGPATVSSDVLRHPLTSKARRLLEKAMHWADLGNHPAAIQSLKEAMVKCPSAAPYAHNLLGLEYIENQQFDQARSSFEEAVRLMPHESGNHSNLGYSMAIAGEWNSAEEEARKAIRLDPANSKAKTLLEMLLLHKRRSSGRQP